MGRIDRRDQACGKAVIGRVSQRSGNAHGRSAMGFGIEHRGKTIDGAGRTDPHRITDVGESIEGLGQESATVVVWQTRFVASHSSRLTTGQDNAKQFSGHVVGSLVCFSSTSSTQDRARIIVGNPIVGAETTAT